MTDTIMRDTMLPSRLIMCATAAVLLLLVGACRNGAETEPSEGLDTGPAIGPQRVDTTRLRETYDRIGQQYRQIMGHYQGMSGEMTSETRQLYEQMQQHYEQMMPEGGMTGMMGRHMMAMHDRGAWSKQMLDLHQRMVQLHAQEGRETMAEMHEEMVELYQDALANMPAAD